MEQRGAAKFEIDPTGRQRSALALHTWMSRAVWNWALAARREDYEHRVKPARERGEKARGLGWIDQQNAWLTARDDLFPHHAEVSAHVAIYAVRDLDKAYGAWWSGLKAKRRCGPPRFRRRGEHESFRTRGSVAVRTTATGRHEVKLPVVGWIRIKGDDITRLSGAILAEATVREQAGRWFVALSWKQDVPELARVVGPIIGIDLGIAHSITTSDGRVIESPRPLRAGLKRLRRIDRQIARQRTAALVVGLRKSNRQKRREIRRERLHMRVAAVRGNWLHETTTDLARTASVIGIEDLNLRGMMGRKRHLGRAFADLGAAEFRRQLEYKTVRCGSRLVIADRFYPSSKLCSHCGARKDDLTLKDRTYRCDTCGLVIDRDLNAARNLRSVAAVAVETQNAQGGDVRPGPARQSPVNCEPGTEIVARAA